MKRGSPVASLGLALLAGACGDARVGPPTTGEAARPRGASSNFAPRAALSQRIINPSGETGPFVDLAEATGLEFTHDAGLDGSHFMPEIMGSGCALFDADGDGDLDAFLVGFGPHAPAMPRACSRLFRQDDDAFADVTRESGLAGIPQGMGVATGDVDNDGDVDVYLTGYGADALFRNDGGLRFTDVTAASGIGSTGWTTSAGFFDYDRDGWLDLSVARYVDFDAERDRCLDAIGNSVYCGPSGLRGMPSLLYHGEGGGRFRDVSAEAGIAARPGKGLGVALADFTNDGLSDIFVANDREPAFLWVNQGNGRFVEEGMRRGCAVNQFGESEAGMGVALGDADGDLALDLFVTHLTREQDTLYLARGARFVDASASSGVAPASREGTGFGTAFLDLELDGDLDIAVVNGAVQRLGAGASAGDDKPFGFTCAYGQRAEIWVNAGAGQYATAGEDLGHLRWRMVGRGLAVGDIDDDGDVDMLTTSTAAEALLLMNRAERSGSFLIVRAWDAELRRDAVGARVTVHADGTARVGLVTTAGSYLSAGDPRLHFGLGATARVESIDVAWPNGSTERFDGVAANQSIVLTRGQAPRVGISSLRARMQDSREILHAVPSRDCWSASMWYGPPPALEPQVREAMTAADEAVRASDDDGAAHAKRGVLLHAHEMFWEAADEYWRARTLMPGDARWPYLRAIIYLQTDAAQAITDFDAAIALKPNFIPALVHRAHALRMLGRDDEAARALDAVLALDPRCAQALLERAQLHRAADQPALAAPLLDTALQVAPTSRELHAEKALMLRVLGRDAEADGETAAAERGTSVRLLMDPLLDQVNAECISTPCLLERAAALRTRDPAAALALIDRVIALRPDLPEPPRMRQQLIAEMSRRGRP